MDSVTAAANKRKTKKKAAKQAASNGKKKKTSKDSPDNYGYPVKKKKKTGKAAMIAVICVVALALLAVGGVYVYDRVSDDGLILDNVYAAGINLGNMSQQDAVKALQGVADSYTTEKLTVELPDCKLVLSPEETKASLDVNKLAEDAWNYGRDGNVLERIRARADGGLTSYTFELTPYLNLDTEYIQKLLAQLSTDVSSQLTQPAIQVTGQRPADGEEEAEGQKMTITMGTADRSIDTDSLYEQIMDAYLESNFAPIVVSYAETLPEMPDLQEVYDTYCTPAVDAILDENTYDVTPEIAGYGFILEDVQKQVDEAEEGQVIEVAFQTLEPEITEASLKENLFQDILGQCSTKHTYNPPRTNNLVLACEAVDGYIVKPGEVFSFNEVVGERTAAKGYQEATIYSGGQSVPGLGGGVCQVASTIYCCALYADLEIVERTCHQFYTPYVPHLGMDATVYWGSLDFKFRNNTDYPIRIEADTSDGYVNVTLWGKDTKSYTVDIESEIIATYPWSTQYREIKEGSSDWGKYTDGQVLVEPYTGYKIETYKVRTDKETGETTREWEAETIFDTRDKVVVKLIYSEPEPTQPAETQPTEPEPTQEPEPAQESEPTAEGSMSGGSE